MTPWRRAWLRRFPMPEHDAERHEEDIAQAKQAAAGARRQQGDAEQLGEDLERRAHTLRVAGDRNHFSEMLGSMLESSARHGKKRV